MERFGDIPGIIALVILAWQDFRTRRIAWWLLPVLAASIFLAGFASNSAKTIGQNFSINMIFLLIQFLLVWIWFSAKNKRLSRIIDTQIGLGDVLFMICVALAFSPGNFLIFYIGGMILTLISTVLIKIFRQNSVMEIPLAGALSVPLILLCGWRLFNPGKDFYNDAWLMQLVETNLNGI
ncbi:MAG: hypothetical protein M3R17_08395 [Bacteroidota bacterium]|nr:hypothetical protein [Bacteroidota bacterium]